LLTWHYTDNMTIHLSSRLVWHDQGWNGCICDDPLSNSSCMVHDYVRESRNDIQEVENSGKTVQEIDFYPPCMADISLLSAKSSEIIHNDPLDWRNLPHIDEDLPPYTFCARPYGRMFSEEEGETWTNDPYDQKERLDNYFDQIETGKSLVFFYTNHGNPFLDEVGDRLLVGVARVAGIGPQHYFPKKGNYQDDYPLWSRAITIDPDESFFIPYQEYLNLGEDCSNIICGISNSIRANYSYVSEHLTDDIAVISLESLINVARALQKENLVKEDWESKINWLDGVLGEAWKNRGPYPGIGSVLDYLEFRRGYSYQFQVLSKKAIDGVDVWEHVQGILDGNIEPETSFASYFQVAKEEWEETSDIKKELLSKLALFELSSDQIKRILNSSLREQSDVTASIEEIIENPYLLCEQDIGGKDSPAIGFEKIDHGMIPLEGIAETWSQRVPISSRNRRRVRAFMVEVLKRASGEGHTILPLNEAILRVMKLVPEERACEPDVERILENKEFYTEVLEFGSDQKNPYVSLISIRNMEKIISEAISELVSTPKYDQSGVDWYERLVQTFGPLSEHEEDIEKRARDEKVKALESMISHRFSVLTGRAGTGKTSLMKILIEELQEKERKEILLLAPTGKARIRLQEKTNLTTRTIHQYLFQNNWINKDTYSFKQSGGTQSGASTVIIDEASMIPVDLLGTLFKALNFNEIKRLILIGDPNQLPPIGPGRPFVDIINWLKSEERSNHIAYLRERRRQKASQSIALSLSDGYVAENPDPNDDEILSDISREFNQGDLEVYYWDNEDELYSKIEQVMQRLLSLDESEQSYTSFNNSLGINIENSKNPESWQILSPVRMHRYGVKELNRIIQRKYRIKLLSPGPWSKIPKPFGNEKIVWTDKVIQNVNRTRRKWDGKLSQGYVANGEIGYVKSTRKIKSKSDYLDVCFTTQEGCTYRYYRSEIDENLELAYAITVHKAQGSDFEIVFLIIPQNARTLSKELIYTGLTRSKEKLVLFVEKDVSSLRNLRKIQNSETIRRNTYLFDPIIMTESLDQYHPENLIHRTQSGEMVRSKSEVIVGNILTSFSLDYEYEKPLEVSDTNFRLPDFTINYKGKTFYWEHLGMLQLESYRRSWDKKLQWYTDNGYLDTLVTSIDESDGSIDSLEIEKIIKEKILDS